MAKSLDELKKELEQLKKELKDLTGEIPVKFDTSSVEDVEKSIKAINSLIKDAKEETKSLSDQFKSSYERLRGITSEMKGQVTPITKTRNAFKQIERSAQDLLLHSSGISTLSDKELVNINKKLKTQIEISNQEAVSLIRNTKLGSKIKDVQKEIELNNLSKEEGNNYLLSEINLLEGVSDEQKAILSSYYDQENVFEEILNKSEEELELRDKANKKLGVTGALLKGISKIPVLGNLIDAQEALTEAQKESREEASTTESVMSTAFSSLGTSLKESLSDPLTRLTLSFTILSKLIKTIVRLAVDFDNRTVEISRNLGMSYESAHKLNKEFMSIAFNSGEVLATSTSLKEAYLNINNSLGTNAQLTDKQLIDQTKILNLTGLTAEESATIAEYSVLTGQSQEDIFDNVMAINTGVISNQKVLQETLTVNGQLAAFYRNQPQLIAQAVTQAQRLGLSLKDTKDISRGLLDFQSSIEAEMQAELMTGKQLNLEQARYLALHKDTIGATKLMLQQVGGIYEFSNLSVLEQEALAKAMGMSTDQLTDALVKQEKLSKLTPQQIEDEAELSEMRETATKRLENATKKIQDSFSRIFAGPVGTGINLFAGILEKISASPLGSMLAGGVGVAAIGASLIGMARVFGRATLLGALPVVDILNGVGGSGMSPGASSPVKGGLFGKIGKGQGFAKNFKAAKVSGGAIGAGIIGGLTAGIMEYVENDKAGMDTGENIGRTLLTGGGAGLGGYGGAALGASIGVAGGPVGILLGGLIGGAIGAMSGGALGDIAGDAAFDTAEDFIIRPGQKPLKYRKDDVIVGGTNLDGGSSNGNTQQLLERILMAIEQGQTTNISVDGNRLNTAVAMNTSKFGA